MSIYRSETGRERLQECYDRALDRLDVDIAEQRSRHGTARNTCCRRPRRSAWDPDPDVSPEPIYRIRGRTGVASARSPPDTGKRFCPLRAKL